jgi:hypothetical protein
MNIVQEHKTVDKVLDNIKVPLSKYWCSEKAIHIKYSECMFVNLSIQNAMRMHHIVICGLTGSTIFSHVIS